MKTTPGAAAPRCTLGDHVGALERAGIPLRQVINEGNHRTWMQPSDPQGLWERALENPQPYADFVVALKVTKSLSRLEKINFRRSG